MNISLLIYAVGLLSYLSCPLIAQTTPLPWSFCNKPITVIKEDGIGIDEGYSFDAPEGEIIASRDGRYVALDVTADSYGEPYLGIIDMQKGTLVAKLRPSKEMGQFSRLAFSPDSQFLRFESSSDHAVFQWDMNDLKQSPICVGRDAEFDTHHLDSSPDKRYCIGTCSGERIIVLDQRLKVLLSLRRPNGSILEPRSWPAFNPTFSPTGQHISARLDCFKIGIWDEKKFSARPIIFFSSSAVNTIQPIFSPDGTCILNVDDSLDYAPLVCWNLELIKMRQATINNLMKKLFAFLASDRAARRHVRYLLEKSYDALAAAYFRDSEEFLEELSPLVHMIKALGRNDLPRAKAACYGSQPIGADFTFEDYIKEVEYQNTIFSIAALDICDFLDTPGERA